jgi:hypothetical protein
MGIKGEENLPATTSMATVSANETSSQSLNGDSGVAITRTNGSVQRFGDTGISVIDGEIQEESTAYYKPLDPAFFKSASSGVDSDIRDFLGRPYPLAQGLFQNTDTATTFPNIQPLTALLALEPYLSKLKGKFLIRADIKLTLQVNANRFQQGRYILAWVPSAGLSNTTSGEMTAWLKMHRYSLPQITQLPHVEVDINKDSEAILRIPYTGSFLGYSPQNFTRATGDVGWIFLYPYVPLAAASGALDCGYTLYVELENIDLGGPCLPQMAWNSKKKKGNVQDKEEQEVSQGKVSGFLRNISLASGQLSKIPLLTSFAQPVMWTSDILANVASIWGWSRPNIVGAPTRIVNNPLLYHANSDVADPSQTLALTVGNKVPVLPGVGGNNIDEMSIDFIKQIPSYLANTSWDTSQAVSTILGYGYHSPVQTTPSIDVVAPLVSYSAPAYLARNFQQWRGGMVIKYKIIKTDFHSGRLLFTYNPVSSRTADFVSSTIHNSPYIHREIWDIRDNNEFTVTLPYMSIVPWLSTQGTTNNTAGYWNLIILEPLRAPATVSSRITLVLEVAGAPDLEFSVPITNDSILYPVVPFSQQMGWSADKNTEHVEGCVGGAKLGDDGLLESSSCIGEKILSIRSLLKRYTLLFKGLSTASLLVHPFTMDVATVTPAGSLWPPLTNTYSDLVTFWSVCYAINRGGMRFRENGSSTVTGVKNNVAYLVYDTTATIINASVVQDPTTYGGASHLGVTSPTLIADLDKSSALEYTVPQYNFTHSRPTAAYLANVGVLGASVADGNITPIYVRTATDSARTITNVWRNAADDYSLHCFVSIPPLSG